MANKLGSVGKISTGFLKGDKSSNSQKVDVDSFKLNEKYKMEKSNKIEKKKLSMESMLEFSSVDPTIFWSTMVLIIASILVIGATVLNVGAERNAVYGDSVNVDYTGSYYGYFDEDNKHVFDRSQLKIKIDESNRDKYPFVYALIGHHPGEEIKFCVKNESDPHTEKIKNNIKIKRVDTFSMSEYISFFGIDAPSEVGIYDDIDSPYGWPAKVIINTIDPIMVEYKPDKNTTHYSIKDSSTKIKVTDVTTDSISFMYEDILKKEECEKERDTVRIVLDKRFVYAVDKTKDDIIYRNNEKTGADLYYVVKFISHG